MRSIRSRGRSARCRGRCLRLLATTSRGRPGLLSVTELSVHTPAQSTARRSRARSIISKISRRTSCHGTAAVRPALRSSRRRLASAIQAASISSSEEPSPMLSSSAEARAARSASESCIAASKMRLVWSLTTDSLTQVICPKKEDSINQSMWRISFCRFLLHEWDHEITGSNRARSRPVNGDAFVRTLPIACGGRRPGPYGRDMGVLLTRVSRTSCNSNETTVSTQDLQSRATGRSQRTV